MESLNHFLESTPSCLPDLRQLYVLVPIDVHAVLAADRSIDLPQQRRRDEPELQSAHVGRGGKPRHVGDDPAPDGQYEGRTVHAQLDEAAVDRLDGLQGLDALAQADQYAFTSITR